VLRNSKRKTHCNTLQHTVIRCRMCSSAAHLEILGLFCAAEFKEANTLQHAATRCNTLQHAATCCITLQHAATHSRMCSSAAHLEILGLFRAAEIKKASTLQHIATHCNKLLHTATHCNTLQNVFFGSAPRDPWPLLRRGNQRGDAPLRRAAISTP